MKILIVMSGGFDTYGPSRHLYHALIEDFLANGDSVHLIESHSTGIDPDVPDEFLKYDSFTYELVNINTAPKRAFVKRYLTGLKYTRRCKKPLKKAKNIYDIVLVQSCVWAPFMVPLVKKLTQSFVVWNIQDMFPGASIANGVLKNKLLQKFFYKLHKRAYRKADHITVISDDMKLKVIAQGYDDKRITVISDWFDDKTVKRIRWEENLFVKNYSLEEDKFYVQYAGTMGFNFDYMVVVKVAELLKDQKDIVFQMIGFGSQMDVFMKEVKERQLENVVFYPLQKQDMISHVYSACSVTLIPLPRGVIGNSVPSKIGLLMACKKPVISTSDKDSLYVKMINDNLFGFAYGDDEYQKVADGILTLKSNPKMCEEMGNKGYEFGHVIFSRSYNTKKYIDLFHQLGDTKK